MSVDGDLDDAIWFDDVTIQAFGESALGTGPGAGEGGNVSPKLISSGNSLIRDLRCSVFGFRLIDSIVLHLSYLIVGTVGTVPTWLNQRIAILIATCTFSAASWYALPPAT